MAAAARAGSLAAGGAALWLALLAGACGQGRPEPGAAEAGGEWRQWRGPAGQGVSPAADLPSVWSRDSENVRWRVRVPGMANSSPVLGGGRVFLTTAEATGEEQAVRSVVAIDAASGEVGWKTDVFSGPTERKHHLTSYATPTPATDGSRLYAYFGSHLASLDYAGNLLWTQEVDPGYFVVSRYGAASSPVLVGDKVVVLQDREYADRPDVGWLAAWDKQTGERLWRTEWEDTCCSYSTPLVRAAPGGDELLLFHSGSVAGYAADSGEKLWSADHSIMQPVPSLLADGDLLIAVGGTHKKGAVAWRLSGVGRETRIERLWAGSEAIPAMASPVLYQGRLFVVSDAGVLTCYEATTGKRLWKKRLARGNYRASLVAGDGKVYVTSDGGATSVVAAAEEYRLLSENRIDERGDASPAIADGCLLLRTYEHLYCIEPEGA